MSQSYSYEDPKHTLAMRHCGFSSRPCNTANPGLASSPFVGKAIAPLIGTLRLRGGHRKSGFKKRKAAMGNMRAPRRIHGMMHEFRKRRKRDELVAQQEESVRALRALGANRTEDGEIIEERPTYKLRELRLWEITLGDVLKSIKQYKILHPEVFEEERRDRLDNVAAFKVRWCRRGCVCVCAQSKGSAAAHVRAFV